MTDGIVAAGTAAEAAPAPAVGPRKPWIAAVLALFAPILGYLYAGRARRGLVLWPLAIALSLALLHATLLADHRWTRLLVLALIPLVMIALMADAAWAARRANPLATRRGYQRKWIYGAVFVGSALLGEFVTLPLVRAGWRAFSLKGPNMFPTLVQGDYVFTARGQPAPRRGAVVTRLTDEGYESVVRIAGIAGDTVSMRGGQLVVNGHPESGAGRMPAVDDDWQADGGFGWQREYLARDTAGYAPTAADWGPLVVPPGHVFVLGDNRARSLDSRHLGFFPLDWLTGRVDWIYFSREPLTGEIRWSRIGREVH